MKATQAVEIQDPVYEETYTAHIQKNGAAWIGWIPEVPEVKCEENTREVLLKTLVKDLHEVLEAEQEAWEKQFEADVKAGHLDDLSEKALANFRAGRYYEIEELQKLCGTHLRKHRTWHEVLVEQLMAPDEALDYLQFAISGYQEDGDTSFFLRALSTIVESQGGIAEVAKKIGIVPESLVEILESDDPPRIDTFGTILTAFGWQLSIKPLENVELNTKTQDGKRVDLNTAAEKRASSVFETPAS